MSEAKFTPGPWTHNPQFPTSVWAYGLRVATANVETVASLVERTANAHLIAAAPEMYEALKDVEWEADGFCPQCSKSRDSDGHSPRCILANALAKARGEAQ